MQESKLIRLGQSEILHDISIEFPQKRIIIDKSEIGNGNTQRLQHNILAVGRNNQYVRKFVIELANNGFFLVAHDAKKGVSTFEKLDDYEEFKHNFYYTNIRLWNGTYYTLEGPLAKDAVETSQCRLLVLFSSIADFPLNASIARRSFYRNWDKVLNYIPRNTYVLRIADIGGVLGSFYLNSNFDLDFENKIQDLIGHMCEELNISRDNLILFGTSKGATGAFYHGMVGGYNTVAVDPIIADEYYIKNNDQHFVDGGFPESKEDKFGNIMSKCRMFDNINIITSRNSQQFKYIYDAVSRYNIKHYIFTNSSIKAHPDVGGKTLIFVTTLINALFYKIYNNVTFESDY